MTTKADAAHVLLALVFIGVLAVPLAGGLIGKDLPLSPAENRALASCPALPKGVEEIKNFPKLFEGYYSDHFGLREKLVRWYSSALIKLGISPSEEVILGKDGWLFYANKEQRVIEGIRNIDPLTKDQLETWKTDLTTKYRWLKRQGIPYLLLIAPSKDSIYPEYLPARLRKNGEPSRCDQFIAYMRAHTEAPILDLRPALIAAKTQSLVYPRYDTHWNEVGANIVQYEVANYVRNIIPGIHPALLPSTAFTWVEEPGGDLANMIALGEVLTEYEPSYDRQSKYELVLSEDSIFQCITTCDDADRRALVFADSFYLNVMPQFSQYFKQVVYVFARPTLSLIMKYVCQYHPDIVLEEKAERLLVLLPKPDLLNYQEEYERKFEGSGRTVFQLDAATYPQFTMLSQGRLGTATGGKSMVLDAADCDPQIEFPEQNFAPGKTYMIRIRMTSPHCTMLQLFFSKKGPTGSTYCEKNSMRITLAEGCNTLYVYLHEKGLGPFIRLDPGLVPGQYVIHQIEIREISPM